MQVVPKVKFKGNMSHANLRDFYEDQYGIILSPSQFIKGPPLVFNVNGVMARIILMPGETILFTGQEFPHPYCVDCNYDAGEDKIYFELSKLVRASWLDQINLCLVDPATGNRNCRMFDI